MSNNQSKVKYLKSSYGNGLSIGLLGEKLDIEQQYNIFYNYKITGGSLIWQSDNFGYIVSSKERFIKGFTALYFTVMRESKKHSKYFLSTVGLKRLARLRAIKKFNLIPTENFINLINGEEFVYEFKGEKDLLDKIASI